LSAARRDLLRIYRAALTAVDGRRRVAEALRGRAPPPALRLVALGKAAEAMAEGAWDVWGEAVAEGLLITKYDHVERRRWVSRPVEVIEAGHPLPDDNSLLAGERLLRFVAEAPVDAGFLFLISGGASALAEALAPGATLAAELRALNRWLLASGADIHHINRIRKAVSRLKGGRLARALAGRPALQLLISDVRGDDPAVIGSGPLQPGGEPAPRELLPPELAHLWLAEPPPAADDPALARLETRVIAANGDALAAAAARAAALGYPVHRHAEFVGGEAAEEGARLARALIDGPPGIHLWGGEPVVTLPAEPGRGGRAQTLALAAARILDGRGGLYLLAAGTDGSDGPTEDAGALVDGASAARCRAAGIDPAAALASADAGSALAAAGDLIHTGPTGSNVMDIMIGLKTAE